MKKTYTEKYKEKIKKQKEQIDNTVNWKRNWRNGKFWFFLFIYFIGFMMALYMGAIIAFDKRLYSDSVFRFFSFICFFYILFIFILPLKTFITYIIFRFSYYRYNKFESKTPDTAIIIAHFDFFNLKDWLLAPFEINFRKICKTLIKKEWKFKIFYGINENEFDEIIYNNQFKKLFLIGHGSRHSFALYRDKPIYYSKYSECEVNKDLLKKINQKTINKEFIAQYHCNHGCGKSLADYIVKPENRENCDITWDFWRLGDLNEHINMLFKEEKR
ncbi:MAG: hypothetical protein KC589_00090 [Nanoarchaeota archaeon]|nr:hypothetical protein [Nanoarchaeota archaeon]MCA9495318.1 hypothetical protein [Nanoarchaeota archaeon]